MNKNIIFSLCLFPLTNIGMFLFCGDAFKFDSALILMLKQLIIYLLIAFAEELFFRGLVLNELVFSYNWQPSKASFIISILFGLLHLLNVNSYASWAYALIQSICAFGVSFNLSAIFVKTKSLWWCVCIHALTNISSILSNCTSNEQPLVLSNGESMIFLLMSFVYLFNGIKILDDTIGGK